MAGYSAKPLQKKSGVKPGPRAAFVSPPNGFWRTLGPLADGLRLLSRPGKRMDIVLPFCRALADLQRPLPAAASSLAPAGILWIAWPKRPSGLETDPGAAKLRSAGLETGLADVKICAVDDVWSGLQFVRRVADR